MRMAADEWDLVAPLLAYIINHRFRAVLGGKSAIEVVTGLAPDSAVKLAVYSGKNMKEAVRYIAESERVSEYCDGLVESLDRMHQEVKDRTEAVRRRKELRQARHGPGQHFNVGDLVLVPSFGNSANKSAFRPFKPMTGWQGPYEVTECIGGNPTEYMVRLLGDTKQYPVHWRKMKRLAGPDLPINDEVVLGAQHDTQRFMVDHFKEWSINTDGEVDVLVHWQRHEDDEEDTWEPLEQLVKDVPAMIAKYVQADKHHQLVAAHRRCVAEMKKKK
jgi:hypothetical protein